MILFSLNAVYNVNGKLLGILQPLNRDDLLSYIYA